MNLTAPAFFGKKPQHNGRRLVRAFVAILSVCISSAVPALADTVRINQVVQTLTSSKSSSDIKLSTVISQDPVSPGTKGSSPQSGPKNDSQASNQGGTKTGSIVTGIVVSSQGQQIGVDISEEGEVEGTICDCGEILIAGGAFPKWPFLFLGAIPLVFISDCDDCDEPPRQESPTPTPPPSSSPTPTPTPPGVPEPASLLLFGTGLAAVGAGLRRRYAKSRLGEQSKAGEEE